MAPLNSSSVGSLALLASHPQPPALPAPAHHDPQLVLLSLTEHVKISLTLSTPRELPLNSLSGQLLLRRDSSGSAGRSGRDRSNRRGLPSRLCCACSKSVPISGAGCCHENLLSAPAALRACIVMATFPPRGSGLTMKPSTGSSV